MPARAIVFLATGALCAAAHAADTPIARADRPVSDITCARGEPATYNQGAHRFYDRALVLGCMRLSGGSLQIDGGAPGRRGPDLPVAHLRPDASRIHVRLVNR
jgi:hypothetical protein